MAQVRDSAVQVVALAVVLCLVHCKFAESTVYTVGDSRGWTFNMTGWPDGKSFKANDVLVFNYNSTEHNVVIVEEIGYEGCTVGEGDQEFNSGHDQITLIEGDNFFICSIPGHCQAGIKINVTAA